MVLLSFFVFPSFSLPFCFYNSPYFEPGWKVPERRGTRKTSQGVCCCSSYFSFLLWGGRGSRFGYHIHLSRLFSTVRLFQCVFLKVLRNGCQIRQKHSECAQSVVVARSLASVARSGRRSAGLGFQGLASTGPLVRVLWRPVSGALGLVSFCFFLYPSSLFLVFLSVCV